MLEPKMLTTLEKNERKFIIFTILEYYNKFKVLRIYLMTVTESLNLSILIGGSTIRKCMNICIGELVSVFNSSTFHTKQRGPLYLCL